MKLLYFLFPASLVFNGCGVVLFSPSASDQEEASHVAGIVSQVINNYNNNITYYASRETTAYHVDVYGISDMDKINHIVNDLKTNKYISEDLSTRKLHLTFYERENLIVTSRRPDGTANGFERANEVLVKDVVLILP